MDIQKEREAFCDAYPAAKAMGFDGEKFTPVQDTAAHRSVCMGVNDMWKVWQVRAALSADAGPVAWMLTDAVGGSMLEFQRDLLLQNQCRYGGEIVPLYAAPQPQPAAFDYSDAYRGARDDLATWKKHCLEAEARVRQLEQIIDNLAIETQGETRMGEPLVQPYEAPREKVNAMFKALGLSGTASVGDIQDAALARIQAKPQPAAVPDGYALVPVEPTPEMVSAAEEAHMPFGDMDIALRMAILSATSAPATVQGDGWIPVSERLPNVVQEVIVNSEFDGITAGFLDSYGEWYSPNSDYKLTRVFAWQPLPAPPAIAAARQGGGKV